MAPGAIAVSEAARRARASALPPDERRSMIVRATLPLLLENGEMVTTRQIADAAGIAEGTIFRVFADKEELIAAVVETALDPVPLEEALAAVDVNRPLEACLESAITILQQRVVDIWRLVSSIGGRAHEHSRQPMQDSEALTRLFRAHRDRLSVKPTAAARLLRALTLSMTHPMLVADPMAPREIVKLFLHGVCGEKRC